MIRLIARFANYVVGINGIQVMEPWSALGSGQEGEVARTILSDLILGSDIKTQDWSNLLKDTQDGLNGLWSEEDAAGTAKARDAIIDLRLPEEAKVTAEFIRSTLLNKVGDPDGLIRAGQQQQGDLYKIGRHLREAGDVVTKGLLETVQHGGITAAGRADLARLCYICVGCGGRWRGVVNEETASEWELSRIRSCLCGGGWVITAA